MKPCEMAAGEGGAAEPPRPPDWFSRRFWLSTAVGAIPGLALPARGSAQSQGPEKAGAAAVAGLRDAEVLDQVRARARKAGLGAIAFEKTEHFLSVGDAPDRFQAEALRICEALGKAFLAYFRQRGFPLAFPDGRMTVVTLKDDASYRAYLGKDAPQDQAIGGHYELGSNQLVVFDFRSRQQDLAVQAARVNTLALIHEATHLLCFNSGLLAQPADVPVCISEGLATCVELWRPQDRVLRATTNRPRLQVLDEAGADKEKAAWIAIADLLADDARFDIDDNRFPQPGTAQLAYAESWLMVHLLLRTPWLPKFQKYLAGIPRVRGPQSRRAHAETTLGPLQTLDQEVLRHKREVLRR